MNKKALVVLSGGQDSTVCLYWAVQNYEEVHAITFDYGQRHRIELMSASLIAEMAKIASHRVVVIPKEMLMSTSPLNSSAELDKYENFEQMQEAVGNNIEKTFVPMRNQLFLTIAANYAAAGIGNCDLVTGICQEDNANYPDCTEQFRYSLQLAINNALGTDIDSYIKIQAPLMFKSKAETCRMALDLKGCYEALAYSHTSYDGQYPPTDNNHSNLLRAEGFKQAGIPDPLVVRAYFEKLMLLPITQNYQYISAYESSDSDIALSDILGWIRHDILVDEKIEKEVV